MYNYTKKIYKAVKSTLKTQIEAFSEVLQERQYRKCVSVWVYHPPNTPDKGRLVAFLKNFFEIFFGGNYKVGQITFFQKIFFLIFSFFLRKMAGVCIFVVGFGILLNLF